MDEAGPVQLKTFSPSRSSIRKLSVLMEAVPVRGPDPQSGTEEGEKVPMHRPPCQGLAGWLGHPALQDRKESYR